MRHTRHDFGRHAVYVERAGLALGRAVFAGPRGAARVSSTAYPYITPGALEREISAADFDHMWALAEEGNTMKAPEVNVEELHELAELLAESTPADTAEMSELCGELHRAMDLKDAITAAEKAATAALVAQLEALKAPYRAQLEATSAVQLAAKAALARRIEADEQEALAAIAAKCEVPAPRELPKGLRVTRATVLTSVDLDVLDDKYKAIVADTNAILAAADAGLTPAGATVDVNTSVVYTRPKAAKK